MPTKAVPGNSGMADHNMEKGGKNRDRAPINFKLGCDSPGKTLAEGKTIGALSLFIMLFRAIMAWLKIPEKWKNFVLALMFVRPAKRA